MGRVKDGRMNGNGTLEKRGDIWLARWVVNGKRFTRSTECKVSGGKKAKKEAEKKLKEFTLEFRTKDEKLIIEKQMARIAGIETKIAEIDAKKPAIRMMEGWSVYLASQSRPRSGADTLRNYEQQYFIFVDWLKEHHPDVEELRQVTRVIAEEYAKDLLAGTPDEESAKITEARKWLYRFDYRRKTRPNQHPLSPEAEASVNKRRALAARTIRKPIRGNTFNKHMNALTLIWRHVSRDERARFTDNPWGYDEETGDGIRRIILNHAERPHKRRNLTIEEVFRLLKTATGELRTLIALGFYTGLRLGDAVQLEWENIDRVTGTINARSRKTDTETCTKVHPALGRILEAAGMKSSGFVMPKLARTYRSGKSGRVEISEMISALFNSIGIKTKCEGEDGKRARSDCGFHSLRHTFVTALRARGATLQVAKELAGHNSDRMTEHYTHDDERAVLALPDVVGDKPTNAKTYPYSLSDFRAVLSGLSPEDRATAVKECAAELKNTRSAK